MDHATDCRPPLNRFSSIMPAILTAAMIVMFQVAQLRAQEDIVLYGDVDASEYPIISAQFLAFDALGRPILDLSPEDFIIQENRKLRDAIFTSCPDTVPAVPISSVLTIDASLSMVQSTIGVNQTRLDLAKKGARAWVEGMDFTISNCAVTSFNDFAYLHSDFSRSKNQLLAAIDAIEGGLGTNFYEAFMGNPAGALPIAAAGSEKRIVVFLTDGSGKGDQRNILEFAMANDIRVYSVVLGQSAPPLLRKISKETGGLWFDNLSSANAIAGVYRLILRHASGNQLCSLQWLSEPHCDRERAVSIRMVGDQAGVWNAFYRAPERAYVPAIVTPEILTFDYLPDGASQELPIVVTAEDTLVLNELRPLSPYLSIVEVANDSNTLPVRIDPGDTMIFHVRYEQVGGTLLTSQVVAVTDGCIETPIVCVGREDQPRPDSVRITYPNGGERFVVGSRAEFRWDDVGTADPVRLEFSNDAGQTWSTVAERAVGLSIPWDVPLQTSDKCLARVTVLNPDKRIERIDHPRTQVDVQFTKDDSLLVILSEDGTITRHAMYDGTDSSEIPGLGAAGRLAVTDDGRYAAVGGTIDGTAMLFDLDSAELIVPIYNAYLPRASVQTLQTGPFVTRPNSTTLLTAVANDPDAVSSSVIRLYDISTGTLLREFSDAPYSFRAAAYSDDGEYCVLAGDDGAIRVWNGDLTGLITTITDPAGDIALADFTDDAREVVSIAVADNGRWTLSLWNLISGSRVMNINLPGPAYDLDVGRIDVTDVALVGLEGVARVYDLRKGMTEKEYGPLSGPVRGVSFNGDATSVAATAGGSTRVWTIDTGYVRTDISDSLWAIVAPSIAAYDIDFGEVLVRTRKDSTVTAYIRNTGEVPVRITGISILGAHDGDYSLLNAFEPMTIAPGEAEEIQLSFRPGDLGPRRAIIEIQTYGLALRYQLSGVGISPALNVLGLTGDMIDFGKVRVGSDRDSVAWLMNVGNAAVTIDNLRLRGPDNVQFTILGSDPVVPVALLPGDSIQVRVRFSPVRIGRTQGGVDVEHDGLGSPTVVGLFGQGIEIGSSDPAISVSTVAAFPDQECSFGPDTLTLSITNPGTADLNVTSAVIAGTNAAEFGLTEPFSPLTIAPGNLTSIAVIFLPSGFGRRTAELTIKSNATDNPETVIALSGNAAATDLSLSHTSIDLGRFCPSDSRSVDVRLRNRGELAALVGVDILNVDQHGGRLDVGTDLLLVGGDDSTSVQVSFEAGSDAGSYSATARFVDSTCGEVLECLITWDVVRPKLAVKPVDEICPGESVRLSAAGTDAYRWEPSSGLSCADCPDPIATPRRTTTYYVTGTDAGGCSVVDSVTVVVGRPPIELHAGIGRSYRSRIDRPVSVTADLRSPVPADAASIDRLVLRVEYDPSVVIVDVSDPKDLITGTILDDWIPTLLENSRGTLEVGLDRGIGAPITSGGPLLTFNCRAFLAGESGSDLSLQIETPTPCTDFRTSPGYVGIDSLCGLDYRLFELGFGKYAFAERMRNPIHDRRISIPFSLGLDGETQLDVFDGEGLHVGRLIDRHLEAGDHEVLWNAEDLPSGAYYLHLRSGHWKSVKRIVVVR